ncbi:MAG: hypothetical protein ACOX1P_14440 [Thermoguttaceae bacterium]|jgi:hypothetical protein
MKGGSDAKIALSVAYRRLVAGAANHGWIRQRLDFGEIQRARQAASFLPATCEKYLAGTSASDDNAVELSDIMPSEMPGDAVWKQQHAVSPSHLRHWTGPDSKYAKLREILDKVWAEEARTSSLVETPASESELARLRPPANHSAIRRSHSSWDRLEL